LFYLFSHCEKSKHLLKAEFEEEGADKMRVRCVISRRHPMFMGVIT
jgi:hypothetical protein